MHRKASGAHTGTGVSLCGCGGATGESRGKTDRAKAQGKAQPQQRAEETRREQNKKCNEGTPPATQWLGLQSQTAQDPGSAPGWGTETPQVAQHSKKKKGQREVGLDPQRAPRPLKSGLSQDHAHISEGQSERGELTERSKAGVRNTLPDLSASVTQQQTQLRK